METGLPVDLTHWAMAALPLGILLVLLIGLRRRAVEAAPAGAIAAAATALLAFRAPLENVAIAAAKGIWDAVFILYVIWPALLLYLIAKRAGAFEALRKGMERFSRDDSFLVLAFGWVFASFLQAIAGFGTPIAVAAPLLIAIGVRPLYAVLIPLIGHAWATVFGSIGVTWLATLQVVDMADPAAAAFQAALLLWIPNLLGGLAIAWLFGRGRAVAHALPMILLVSAIHGGGQLLLSTVEPVLSNFIPATAALAALYPLSRWKRYRERPEGIEERPAMEDGGNGEADGEEAPPRMSLGMALFPYALLAALTAAILVIGPVRDALERVQIGIPFPAIATGYGIEIEPKRPYSPFSPFTHPGFFLLLSAAASWALYRRKGCFGGGGRGEEEQPGSLWRRLASDAVPPSAAVMFFLAMSKILDHSGQTDLLALGAAASVPATAFAAISAAIGALGAFITSSSTASNVLLAPLQQTVARIEQLPEATIIGAQSAGGGVGNAIAPANVVLGTTTAGIAGREGEVLRKALPWVGVTVLLTGLATVALSVLI